MNGWQIRDEGVVNSYKEVVESYDLSRYEEIRHIYDDDDDDVYSTFFSDYDFQGVF